MPLNSRRAKKKRPRQPGPFLGSAAQSAYVHLEYRRQKAPGDCEESVVIHLHRSRYFPARLKGFAITMSICEASIERYGPLRELVLASFEEFKTE